MQDIFVHMAKRPASSVFQWSGRDFEQHLQQFKKGWQIAAQNPGSLRWFFSGHSGVLGIWSQLWVIWASLAASFCKNFISGRWRFHVRNDAEDDIAKIGHHRFNVRPKLGSSYSKQAECGPNTGAKSPWAQQDQNFDSARFFTFCPCKLATWPKIL